MEHTNCLVCGADRPEFLYSGFDRLFGIEGEFGLVKCGQCGFVYLNPRPTENEIENYYPKEYYSFQEWKKDVGILKHLCRRIKWKYLSVISLARPLGVPQFRKNSRILDFGCGSGEVLSILKNMGWQTYGVEKEESAAKYARSKGLDVDQRDLKSIHFPEDFFDVVRMRSVLEHLHQVPQILGEIHRILKNDGCLLLITPNVEGLPAKFFKERWYHSDVPRHLYHFTASSLTSFLKRQQFQIQSVRFLGSGGVLGSIDFWLNEKKNRHGMRLCRVRALRWVTFLLCEMWLNLFRSGDLIEVQARKT